ncbi:MAG: hypothetical protein ABL876_14800 [Chitinophagaceae bacterium]
MTDMQKAAEIKKLQMEIDKRCSFFRIIKDMGVKKPVKATHNSQLKTYN